MPAEPPRITVRKVQHLLLDGCRILRDRAAPSLDSEMLAALDRMIAELSPIEGFPIEPVEARLYGLAHGLQKMVEDVTPFIAGGPVDASEFPKTLRRVEEAMKLERDKKVSASH